MDFDTLMEESEWWAELAENEFGKAGYETAHAAAAISQAKATQALVLVIPLGEITAIHKTLQNAIMDSH